MNSMKSFVMVALGFLVLFVASQTSSAQAMTRQQAYALAYNQPMFRTSPGMRMAALPPGALKRVRVDAQRLRLAERRAYADGRISPYEARRLAELKRRENLAINQLKRDSRYRY